MERLIGPVGAVTVTVKLYPTCSLCLFINPKSIIFSYWFFFTFHNGLTLWPAGSEIIASAVHF